jgi:DNA invertase Pin-like site-specific DNA recombinase
MIVGYARVSTDGQTLEGQQSALQQAGCDRVFAEKISGITARPQLANAIAALGSGDMLIVCKLDRLARRSTRDLLNTLDAISKAGASFPSLGDSWANTDTPHGRLMVTVLSGLAEFERHLILAPISEGRTRAKASGVRFGRKPKLSDHQQAEIVRRRAAGETLTTLAKSYGVAHSRIYRLTAEQP